MIGCTVLDCGVMSASMVVSSCQQDSVPGRQAVFVMSGMFDDLQS